LPGDAGILLFKEFDEAIDLSLAVEKMAHINDGSTSIFGHKKVKFFFFEKILY